MRIRSRKKCTEDRFWKYVDKNGPNGCHIWKGGFFGNGYPAFWANGKTITAYVYVWEREHGEIPHEKLLRHTCNNISCVNIKHLYLISREREGRLYKRDCKYRKNASCSRGYKLCSPVRCINFKE